MATNLLDVQDKIFQCVQYIENRCVFIQQNEFNVNLLFSNRFQDILHILTRNVQQK